MQNIETEMYFPKVKLERFLPQPPTIHISKEMGNALIPNRPNKDHEFNLTLPRVWKLILTEDSEKEIFGDLNPWRQACLPPLPFGNEKYNEKKLAIVEEDQVQIYNEKNDEKIEPCVVKVSRNDYNTHLRNAISLDGRKAWLPDYFRKSSWVDIPKGWKVKTTGTCERGDLYWSAKKLDYGYSTWEAVEDSHSFLHVYVNYIGCCITPE